MSDFEKRVDPNATIQIDKIDALELVQLEDDASAKAAESKPPATSRRTAPPPLPPMPEASAGTGSTLPPQSVSAPRPSTGKTLVYGVMFLVLLVGAIVGGLVFGSRVRGEPATAATASAAPSASAPAAPPPTSHALTVPAVEITGP